MSKKTKKILTVDDLIKFCQEQKFSKFSSKETGYQLAVKVPTTFEVEDNVDENHRGMMKLKFRIFHTGLNRNQSYVSKESATKAMNTIADRPVLAAIHQLDDGTWDFEGHEMEVVTDENGNEELRYIESQVGSFSSEPAFWEHDDELDKDYVCAYAYISMEYTKTCEIIERKNGTKNSCELFIDELAYNAKEKYLDLIDFYINASTLLGSRNDGTEIQEGMQGSRAEIADFSVENNSVKFNKDKQLVELLENLNKTLSNFNKEQSAQRKLKKGGNKEDMFEQLLTKYNKTADDITFDYVNLSEEELEEKFAEIFGKENKDTGESNKEQFENLTRTFDISHEDIRYALYNLLASYEEADNEWYYISGVYDDYFVYENWDGGKIYGQKYIVENDSVALDGERYTLHKEYLTDSEYTELQSMRSNYSIVLNELNEYKSAEAYAEKIEIFDDEAYAEYLETEEFKELMSDDCINKFSKEELSEKADATLGKLIKKNKTFSYTKKSDTKTSSKVNFSLKAPAKKSKAYGTLFKD